MAWNGLKDSQKERDRSIDVYGPLVSWNDLTERQKQLERIIEGCGVKLENSRSCLKKVMDNIGASASEGTFVAQRIQLRLRTQALLGDTDKFISDTEAMLDRFNKDDEEWERRGRNLGFNFWD